MPSDSSPNQRPQNLNEKELVETLGNPTASEEEWLKAHENLGDYKPKATTSEARNQKKKLVSELSVLAAVGLGIFSLISFTQPSNISKVPAPPPASVQVDVDFGPYMGELQRNIKRHWFPPKGNESKRVVVVFKVFKDGKISNLRLVKTSGVAIADKVALKAVQDASATFRPLPPGAEGDVDIQFTFDYNVFNRTDKSQKDSDDSSD